MAATGLLLLLPSFLLIIFLSKFFVQVFLSHSPNLLNYCSFKTEIIINDYSVKYIKAC